MDAPASPVAAPVPPPSKDAPAPVAGTDQMLECDYDTNPTVLYQAIEAKQWEYAIAVFEGADANKQAATWVFRKETSGKLRWRLLPIHAAIIFGSPIKLIELLLGEYPQGAQCKDDQGMLPLHLCFRNEVSWEIVEEIITAFPEAYYVKDRKGRTPITCGVRTVGASGQSVSSQSMRTAGPKSPFKSALSVLGIMTDIAVNAEMLKVREESRTILESRVAQLQDTHLQTLTQLKKEWHKQRSESKRNTNDLQDEIASLKSQLEAALAENADLKIAEDRLTSRVEDLTAEVKLRDVDIDFLKQQKYETLQNMNEQVDTDGQEEAEAETEPSPEAPDEAEMNEEPTAETEATTEEEETKEEVEETPKEDFSEANLALRQLVESMVEEKKEYHSKFGDLVVRYQELAMERKQIMEVFGRDSQDQFHKELDLVQGFQNWIETKEGDMESVDGEEADEREEKKDDDDAELMAFREQSEIDDRKMMYEPSPILESATSAAGSVTDATTASNPAHTIIDLSDAPSPKQDP